jgi:hypothetical protein
MLVNGKSEESQAETQILHPGSRRLYRYWEGLRGERMAARRSEIEPRDVSSILPNIGIVVRDAGGHGYRWRLAGTAICSLYRQELTGRNVLERWSTFERKVISRYLATVVDDRQPCILRYRICTSQGHLIGVEMSGFPIISARGDTHILCGIFPFRDPALLHYETVSTLELSGARSIWTEPLPGELRHDRAGRHRPAKLPSLTVVPGGQC